MGKGERHDGGQSRARHLRSIGSTFLPLRRNSSCNFVDRQAAADRGHGALPAKVPDEVTSGVARQPLSATPMPVAYERGARRGVICDVRRSSSRPYRRPALAGSAGDRLVRPSRTVGRCPPARTARALRSSRRWAGWRRRTRSRAVRGCGSTPRTRRGRLRGYARAATAALIAATVSSGFSTSTMSAA